MRKIYIYRNGVFTAAYHQLDVIPGPDLDKWLTVQANDPAVNSIWMWE